jgi:hypothetical protein
VEVERYCQRAISIGAALNDRDVEIPGHYHLSIMYVFQTQERWGELWGRRVLGEIRYATGRVEGAAADLRHALSMAEAIGADPDIARCHAGLATLYRRTGEQRPAQRHFDAATTMYREMGMTYWLEKLEKDTRTPA